MKLAAAILFFLVSVCPITWADQLNENNDAETAAVSYLKMLSQDKYTLIENTALSIHCTPNRHKEITEQLKFYRKTNLNDGDVYSIEEKKFNGDFAALLIRSENPASPLRSQIHALAMIKRNGAWLPAPLPCSFSNTNYGYDPAVEKTVNSLELWMAREQAKRENSARKQAYSNMIDQISQQEKAIDLNTTPEEAVHHLIDAIRSKDPLRILAATGASSQRHRIPLESSFEKISRALKIDNIDSDWHFVTDSSVIVRPLKVDPSKKEIAVGFWSPLAKPEEITLYFPFSKSNGKTFAQIPQLLFVELLPKNERRRQQRRLRGNDREKLKKEIVATIFKHLKVSQHTDNSKLLNKILEFHKARNFPKLTSLLPIGDDLLKEETVQRTCLEELGIIWRELNRMQANPMKIIDIMEEDNTAMAPLQFAKIGRPGEFVTIKIWMTKVDNNWHLIPEQVLTDHGKPQTLKAMNKLSKRLEAVQKEQQEQQSKSLMHNVVTLITPLTLDAPSEEKAKTLLVSFRKLLHNKETASALACCAILKETENAQALKIFNYALRGAADKDEQDEILGYTQSGKWSGITLRNHSKFSVAADYPLYLIVNTPKGSRIVLDIDLRYATNRGRKLLNAKTWQQLEATLSKASLNEIKTIFTAHQKISRADIAKNNPEEDQ